MQEIAMASRLQSSVINYDSNPAYGVVSHSQVQSESDIVHDQNQQGSHSATPSNHETCPDDPQHDYMYICPDPPAVPAMRPLSKVSIESYITLS